MRKIISLGAYPVARWSVFVGCTRVNSAVCADAHKMQLNAKAVCVGVGYYFSNSS